MKHTAKNTLPPNPYKRSPIKKLVDLAGRDRELKSVRYYLNLTASGDSPHLALIGQRGVGKTSLLNGTESIARELKLLPIRIDMNELKSKSPGRFWHDMYQTLALSMVKAGCWGGEQGSIYAELLRMIHSRTPGNLEKAVMQIPYVFSCHSGDIDRFECPDALVVNDFKTCLTELESKGILGITLLIDEADCLGRNVPLLQMFRNIFQIVERCSLILAGTEAVFPALSEVFSPIPRQFHRIDVKPFTRWPDTMALVLNPLPKELRDSVAPKPLVLQDLHDLCGGAPDEVQLYCHHMYRTVEDGSSTCMALSPRVFREVLREYRSNSSANVDAVLNAIERLPDKLLFKSKWLSRRNLTLGENISVSILYRELKNDTPLSADERTKVASEMTEGYNFLFNAGITEIDNCIQLAGAPLTAGFWKSFVEVEHRQRWTWDDDSFAVVLRRGVTIAISNAFNVIGTIDVSQGQDALSALQTLRSGKTPVEFDDGMAEMIASALFGRRESSTCVADVTFQMDSPAGKQTFQCRFFEKAGQELKEEQFAEWIELHRTILAGNDISVIMNGFIHWELPSPTELHRLGRISRYRIPEIFGPNEGEQAVGKFGEGDTEGCKAIFSRMLDDRENPQIRNNLAFCQILTGEIAKGLENAKLAVAGEDEPLYKLNKGIGEFLLGNTIVGRQSLKRALEQLDTSEKMLDPDASYVLILAQDGKGCGAYEDIPLGTAIMINLWRMGDMTREELKTQLTTLCPELAETWLATFAESQHDPN